MLKPIEQMPYQAIKKEAGLRGVFKMGMGTTAMKNRVQEHRDANPDFDLKAAEEAKASKAVEKPKKPTPAAPAKKAAGKKKAVKAAKSAAKAKKAAKTAKKAGKKEVKQGLGRPATEKEVIDSKDLSQSAKIIILHKVFKKDLKECDKIFKTNRSAGLLYLCKEAPSRIDKALKKYKAL